MIDCRDANPRRHGNALAKTHESKVGGLKSQSWEISVIVYDHLAMDLVDYLSVNNVITVYSQVEIFNQLDQTFFPPPLPWYQLGLGGLFHPACMPSQFLAPYAVHCSKQRRHPMSDGI